jgi:hypothetical protein
VHVLSNDGYPDEEGKYLTIAPRIIFEFGRNVLLCVPQVLYEVERKKRVYDTVACKDSSNDMKVKRRISS